MIDTIAAVALLMASVPLAMLALKLSKRYRKTAYMAAALLLIFGMNVRVDPPPPPRIVAVEHEDEEALDDPMDRHAASE